MVKHVFSLRSVSADTSVRAGTHVAEPSTWATYRTVMNPGGDVGHNVVCFVHYMAQNIEFTS